MRRAVYPGSFDPITLGHLDILQQAVGLFDEIVVAVLHNPSKQPLFSVAERMRFVETASAHMPQVRVDSFSGLLVHYYQEKRFDAVIRGLRDAADLPFEMQMAHMNRSLCSTFRTIFLPAAPEYAFVSSSLVKDVAMHGGAVNQFVPDFVATELGQRLAAR